MHLFDRTCNFAVYPWTNADAKKYENLHFSIDLIEIIFVDQSNMLELGRELQKTNQRLDEIKVVSIGNFEKTLTEQVMLIKKNEFDLMMGLFQFEEKLQNVIRQQTAWYENERSVLISQLRSLQEVLNKTQRNFTDTIEQVTESFPLSLDID